METQAQRRKRLGVLIKQLRSELKIPSAEALARMTQGAVSRRTIAAIETGERTVSSATYNTLEVTLGIPVGVMEQVLKGETKTIPRPEAISYRVGEESYTREELKTLAKALGQEGFMKWALGRHPDEGGNSASG
ncbi:MAG: hypothetical protein AUG44_08695 [Actinobacteria bacterium 13_1_20CM_3_71_11]|nr:MAG: hypothetical protein AUG44_08695 [Actinobacteria bacterium 13_1_20CM_3_71_11]